MKKLGQIVLLIFIFSVSLYAQDYKGIESESKSPKELSSFLKGLQLYKNKKYQESFNEFHQAYKQESQNPKVLFNLGLSAMNIDKMGYAIGAWRKAQFVSPLFLPAHQALKKLNEKTPYALKMTSWIDRYFLAYVPAELLFVSQGLIFVFFGFLMLKVRKIRRQALKENIDFSFQPFLTKTLISGSLFLVLTSLSVLKLSSIMPAKATSLVEQKLLVTPDQNSTFVNEVSEGDVVLIEQQQGNWHQIKTSKGALGWVPSEKLFIFSGWNLW